MLISGALSTYSELRADVIVEQKFVVLEVNNAGGVVVIKASEDSPGATPQEFTFWEQPKIGSGGFHCVLLSSGTNLEIKKELPMTEKYWCVKKKCAHLLFYFLLWPLIATGN